MSRRPSMSVAGEAPPAVATVRAITLGDTQKLERTDLVPYPDTFTMAVWVRFTGDADSSFHTVFSIDDGADKYRILARDANSQTLKFFANPTNWELFVFEPDVWYFVAVVIDGADWTAYWRAEGETELHSISDTGAETADPCTAIAVGNSGYTEPLEDSVTMFRHWDYGALTEEELMAESRSSRAVRTDQLWCDLRLGTTTGNGVDRSGESNTFTASNEPFVLTAPPVLY